MKKLLLLSLISLSACTPVVYEKKSFILPEELKHCNIHFMSDGWNGLYVVNCPYADTHTLTTGKHSKNVSVIKQPAQTEIELLKQQIKDLQDQISHLN